VRVRTFDPYELDSDDDYLYLLLLPPGVIIFGCYPLEINLALHRHRRECLYDAIDKEILKDFHAFKAMADFNSLVKVFAPTYASPANIDRRLLLSAVQTKVDPYPSKAGNTVRFNSTFRLVSF